MDKTSANYEFLATSFLDAAVAPIAGDMIRKRLSSVVAQFFYLGVVDFIRQVESIGEEEFRRLVVAVFDRYGVTLHMPVEDYLQTVAAQIDNVPALEQVMRHGAEAVRAYWANSDTTAPLQLAALLKSIEGLDEKYEQAFPG